MQMKLIKLQNDLYSFVNEQDIIEYVKKEYNDRKTINSLFNSIIPQEKDKFNFSTKNSFYSNIIEKINPFYTKKEAKAFKLFCLLRSYGSELDDNIEQIIQEYEEIQNITYNNKYANYIKYQVEFQIFCFIVLSSNREYSQEFISSLKKKVDDGNINFKNYCC